MIQREERNELIFLLVLLGIKAKRHHLFSLPWREDICFSITVTLARTSHEDEKIY